MIKLLRNHLKAYRFWLIVFYPIMLVETGLVIFLPILLSEILNRGKLCTMRDIADFATAAVGYICIKFVKEYMAAYLTNSINARMLAATVMEVTQAPLIDLYRMKRIEAIYSVNNMCYFIPFFFLVELPEVVLAIVKMIIIVLALMRRNMSLALLAIVFVILQYIVKQKLLAQNFKMSIASGAATNQFQQSTHDMLVDFKRILINNMQKRIVMRIAEKKEKLFQILKKQVFWESLNLVEGSLFINGVYLVVILFVCKSESVRLGDYEVYLSYIIMLLSSVETFFEGLQFKKEAEAQYRLYLDFSVDKETTGKYYENEIGWIELQEVEFGYEENKLILQKFSHVFEKGKLYVIKGKNGSGKSTLINLICGLFTPQSGKIIVNGIDLAMWDRYRYLNGQIAICDQKTTFLFENLWENIVSSAEMSEKELKKVVKQWGLEDLHGEKSEDYSGGEMQKIGFARMMYQLERQKKGILILDEPMNHLDEKSRDVLLEFLKKQKKDRIVLVVSHGNEFEQICDEVVCLH